MLQLVKGILWLYNRPFGRALLLGIVSWIGLTVLWNQCQVGSSTFNAIAAIFSPGTRAGMYIAELLSADRYSAPLFGVAGGVVVLTSFWYAVLLLVRRMQTSESVNDLTPR